MGAAMIDPTKTLAVCEAATPAPWGHWPEAGSIEIFKADADNLNSPALAPGTKSSEWILVGDVRPRLGWGEEIYEPTNRRPGGDEPDAEFIAQARTELPAYAAFARDVMALHVPEPGSDSHGFPAFCSACIDRPSNWRVHYIDCPVRQLAAKHGIEVAG